MRFIRGLQFNIDLGVSSMLLVSAKKNESASSKRGDNADVIVITICFQELGNGRVLSKIVRWL